MGSRSALGPPRHGTATFLGAAAAAAQHRLQLKSLTVCSSLGPLNNLVGHLHRRASASPPIKSVARCGGPVHLAGFFFLLFFPAFEVKLEEELPQKMSQTKYQISFIVIGNNRLLQNWLRLLHIRQRWANYGPWAICGPLSSRIWPDKVEEILIVEAIHPFLVF